MKLCTNSIGKQKPYTKQIHKKLIPLKVSKKRREKITVKNNTKFKTRKPTEKKIKLHNLEKLTKNSV